MDRPVTEAGIRRISYDFSLFLSATYAAAPEEERSIRPMSWKSLSGSPLEMTDRDSSYSARNNMLRHSISQYLESGLGRRLESLDTSGVCATGTALVVVIDAETQQRVLFPRSNSIGKGVSLENRLLFVKPA